MRLHVFSEVSGKEFVLQDEVASALELKAQGRRSCGKVLFSAAQVVLRSQISPFRVSFPAFYVPWPEPNPDSLPTRPPAEAVEDTRVDLPGVERELPKP